MVEINKTKKERKREYQRKYMREYIKKPEVKAKRKKYEEEHKEERRLYRKEYNQREEVKQRVKENYQTNPKIKKRKREYIAKRRKENINIKLRDRLRASIRGRLKRYYEDGKIPISTNKDIDYKKIIEYLTPFPENIEEYHIDHIIPLVSFDLTNPEEFKKATASSNHQWLLIKDNLSKGARI